MTRRRRGFAIVVALLAIALVAAFVAGAWMIAVREFRSSQAGSAAQLAMEGAEYGATLPAETWAPGDALTAALGSTTAQGTATLAGGAVSSWRMQRLSPTTFLSQGEGRFGHARRAAALFLRLALADFDTTAALTVRDSARVLAGGLVSGADAIPTNWTGLGCALAANGAGTAAPDTTHVCDGNCASAAGVGIVGTPSRYADSTAADSAKYTQFGSETWATLTARAAVVLAPNAVVTPGPVAVGGSCDRSAVTNWGDPLRASGCGNYFPVVYARGDVTINGGLAQGILLAEGDVILSGGALFVGVIVARDDVRSSVGGAHVYGTVLAQDRVVADGVHPEIAAAGVVERSTCAVARAALGAAPLRRVRDRSWTPLYE
jgi:hypothetical protein